MLTSCSVESMLTYLDAETMMVEWHPLKIFSYVFLLDVWAFKNATNLL